MPPKNEKINIITLGCSKNIVDSEVLMAHLARNRFELVPDSDAADVAVINTCGFIETAKQESIDTILQALELKKEGRLKKVVVMGCLSERYAAELRTELPGVDAFVGANKMEEVVTQLGGDLRDELLGERLLTTPKHFAYLKISEGCDRPCSFCSIPLMRGNHVSKPIERVILEARRLALLGVKELIIIAQDSTFYGLDLYGKRMLAPLLAQLAELEGIVWIRLMYAFPTGFPVDVLDQLNDNPKVCRYLDIPVQHASDPVLTSMRRGITSRDLRTLVETIRSRVSGITLRTTLIVGYPTEGDREFEELLQFVNEAKFDRLGVFTYSLEEGTTAFPLGDPIPEHVKEERRSAIMLAQQEISLAGNNALIGKTVKVLVDSYDGDVAIGRTERDAPEVDNEVLIHSSTRPPVGEFTSVRITDASEYDLVGENVLPDAVDA